MIIPCEKHQQKPRPRNREHQYGFLRLLVAHYPRRYTSQYQQIGYQKYQLGRLLELMIERMGM